MSTTPGSTVETVTRRAPDDGLTVAGAHRELLSAEFDVHEETHREPQPRAGWRRLVAWLGASAAAAGVLLWVVCRNALRRSNATRGAA